MAQRTAGGNAVSVAIYRLSRVTTDFLFPGLPQLPQ